MSDIRERVDELVSLMEEFCLDRAELKGKDWTVSFDVGGAEPVAVENSTDAVPLRRSQARPAARPEKAGMSGTPVTSPMMGIFYSSPNPGSPNFVKPGDAVIAGQVVGLIEAMKVFNEITAPVSGSVLQVFAENGQLVQPGEPLVTIG